MPVEAGGAAVTFGGVSTAGTTTFTPIAPNGAGTAPNGFILGGLAYEITTTAAYSSPVTVCFNVPTTFAPTIASFNVLALMHNEGGILVDRTTSRNFATRQICGTVTTLSPFALAEQVDTNLPAITGLIEDSNGNPLGDVSVQLTGTENRTTQTDAFGVFNFVNLTPGGNYNVQPQQVGFLFNDSSHDFLNLAGENSVVFSGAPAVFGISGRVADGIGIGISGVEISLGGTSVSFTTTDANGNYSFSDLPANGQYTVSAFQPLYAIEPGVQIIEQLQGDETEVNFTRFAPTAAQASVSGRVFDSSGRAVNRAGVSITDTNGLVRTAISNPFGYYRFDSVRVGEIYVFSISAKEHQFQTQVFTVNDDITDLNFTALP